MNSVKDMEWRKLVCVIAILAPFAVPWIMGTLLTWIYTEEFEGARDDTSQPEFGRVSAILQTLSAVVYLVYIISAIIFIGIAGTRGLFSFCCLVVGIPVFAVVPIVVGAFLLYTAFTASDGRGKEVGIGASIFCFSSTIMCCFVLCWAIICGRKGRGKNHRYPIPLAYFPFLKDFEEASSEEIEMDDSEKYTSDYPPPRYTFADRKPSSITRHI